MSEPITWLQKHQGCMTRLANRASKLDKIAEALALVGNEALADTIELIAFDIRKTQEDAETALRVMLREDWQESMKQIGKTLDVLLEKR